MKKSLLKGYAELIVKSGLNVQKNQDVVINSNCEIEDFTAMVVEAAYKAGARHVEVRWVSQKATKAAYKNGKAKYLSELLPMEVEYQKWCNKELPAYLWLDADDPDAMKGVNQEKMAAIIRARSTEIWKYRAEREEKYQWCIAGVPGKAWAKKVFPNERPAKAIEKLWEAILSTSRAIDGNGIENWKKHDENLKKRCEYLNNLRLRKLHYTSKKGTDLTVGLIPNVLWMAAGEATRGGTYFQPNIPSEECFTSPMKGEADGIVYASKPLAYNGNLVENFYVRFEKGKAVEVHAEKGQEVFEGIMKQDEGSAYLGECALVPFDSPINNTGILFYNTLYDENAACHLAIGRGFTNLYPGFENMTEDEIHEKGINKSTSHVDFMIGDDTLCITGITEDGNEVAIFKDGNWAF